MGDLFIQYPSGKTLTILQDGTELRDEKPLEIDWCDRCNHWKPRAGGYFVKADGLSLIWLCEACK